jgi:uncharacterized protein
MRNHSFGAATKGVATTAATAFDCWRSKRESERECCHSNQLEIRNNLSPFFWRDRILSSKKSKR